MCKITVAIHNWTQKNGLCVLSGLSWKDVASPVRRGWVCSWRMLDRKCQKHIWNSYIQEVYAWQRRPSERCCSACPFSNPLFCVCVTAWAEENDRCVWMCAVSQTWRHFFECQIKLAYEILWLRFRIVWVCFPVCVSSSVEGIIYTTVEMCL